MNIDLEKPTPKPVENPKLGRAHPRPGRGHLTTEVFDLKASEHIWAALSALYQCGLSSGDYGPNLAKLGPDLAKTGQIRKVCANNGLTFANVGGPMLTQQLLTKPANVGGVLVILTPDLAKSGPN